MTPGRHATDTTLPAPAAADLAVDVTATPADDVTPVRHAARPGARAAWPEVVALAAGAAVFAWRVAAASPWRDEAATAAACRRSLTQLLALATHVDAVHLGYYLVARTVLAVDDSITAVRLVSVAAMALTAAVLTALGRRLASTELGLTAGATLVALPVVSRWAQDARPIALFTLLATVATAVLVEALLAPSRRAWWAAYAGALVALGAVNVLALLVVPAHLAYVLLAHPARRLRPWTVAVTGASIPLLPWLAFTFTQRGQVAWIEPPHLYDLTALYIHAFGSRVVPPVVVLGAVATLVLSRGLPGGGAGQAFVLGAAWTAVPPLLLWGVSLRFPLWDAHYLVFVMPGLALLVAAEIATVTAAVRRRRRRVARERRRLRPAEPTTEAAEAPPAEAAAAPPAEAAARGGRTVRDRRRPDAVSGLVAMVAVPVLAVVGLPAQLNYRDAASGHDEDTRGVATYLQANSRPGDAVLFLPVSLRDVRSLYPERFAQLDDVALVRTPAESESLHGVEVSPADLPARLTGRARVWLVTRDGDTRPSGADAARLAALESGHHVVSRVELPAFRVVLYEQDLPGW